MVSANAHYESVETVIEDSSSSARRVLRVQIVH